MSDSLPSSSEHRPSLDAETAPPTGAPALGQYDLLELLGEGGMGQVYKARHRLMQRIVALKVIRKEQLIDPGAVARFHREIRAAAQLNHPNIILAHDADQVGDTHFFVMEFIEGVDLAKLVQCRGPLPVGEACDCIRQAALGLHHAHERGVIHRDVKPSNLLLTAQDGVVKVLDLGLARRETPFQTEESAALTHRGAVMGTPDYMAPEQANCSHSVDARADIYSLGCAFYGLLTGQPPFPTGTFLEKLVMHQTREPAAVERLRPDVPREVGDILRKMMAKAPGDRFATALRVAEALAPLSVKVRPAAPWAPGIGHVDASPSSTPRLEDRLQKASETPAQSQEAGPPRSRRKWLAVAAGAVVLGLIVAGMQFLRPPKPEDQHSFAAATPSIVVPTQPTAPVVTNPNPVMTPPAVVPPAPPRDAPPIVPLAVVQPPVAPLPLPDLLHRFHAGERIKCVAFDPRLDAGPAFSCGEYTLRQWDLKDSKQLPELRIDKFTDQLIWSIACSFDGKYAVCGTGGYLKDGKEVIGSDNWLLLIDRESQNVRGGFRRLDGKEGHNDSVVSVAFAPDGRTVASGSYDRTVRVWDVATRREICTCRGHIGRVRCVAFPPRSGDVVASGDQEGTVALWDAHTGKRLELLEGHTGAVTCVAFSPDGRCLASASIDGTVRLWNRDDAKDERTFKGHGAPVRAVAFLPDGERLLSGGDDNLVRLWSANNLQEIKRYAGHTKAVTCVAVSPDGKQALSGSDDRSVILWSLPAAKP